MPPDTPSTLSPLRGGPNTSEGAILTLCWCLQAWQKQCRLYVIQVSSQEHCASIMQA